MIRIIDLVMIVVVAVLITGNAIEANLLDRIKRQSEGGNGEVIDNIFNIPITAIKQTAAAAQSFYPEGGSSIDSVFNIPVATLEAVGNLVKNRNSQRLQMDSSGSSEEQKKRRKERRDRLHAHRKGQRLQHNDPFGVNALTDLLVGHHGLFSGHGFLGGHHDWLGDHLSSHLSSHFGAHGSSHGDGSVDVDHDHVGDSEDDSSSSSSSNSDGGDNDYDNNGYEVTEEVEDDRSGWGGWFNFGNLFGGQSSQSPSRNPNKIAPRPDRRKYGRYEDQDAPLENKIAPKYEKPNYQQNRYPERPLENKISPKNDRTNYRRNYGDDSYYRERVAPRREGRNRLVFEHRSY